MSRKMHYVIRVSNRGFNVMDLKQQRSQKPSPNKTLPHLLSALALPYLLGAKTQVKRYEVTAATLSSRSTLATMECFHEASTLFEDLNTVVVYIRKCGKDHKSHQLWVDIRNHIRHAVREEYDRENDKVKNDRAKRLGLDPKLQISIGFDKDAIKVGETVVEITDVKSYLAWAESVIAEILSQAQKDGYFKQEKVGSNSGGASS